MCLLLAQDRFVGASQIIQEMLSEVHAKKLIPWQCAAQLRQQGGGKGVSCYSGRQQQARIEWKGVGRGFLWGIRKFCVFARRLIEEKYKTLTKRCCNVGSLIRAAWSGVKAWLSYCMLSGLLIHDTCSRIHAFVLMLQRYVYSFWWRLIMKLHHALQRLVIRSQLL